jgi:hypothetical protein
MRVIWKSGYGNVLRFLLLYLTIAIVLVNLGVTLIPSFGFQEFISYKNVFQVIGITGLLILSTLLYESIENINNKKLINQFHLSGITDVSKDLSGIELNKVLISSHKIIILNTWIFNIERIAPILRESLKDKKVSIEFNILKASGKYAKERSIELNRDVTKAILSNIDELNHFINNLEKEEQKRVSIFEFNTQPKFSIYGTRENAVISFFFPNLMLVDSPQLEINGSKGYFSQRIWEYYENLDKEDITNS